MDATLSLPPVPEYARVARHVLGEAAGRAGVPMAHLADVRLCVDEAFTLVLRRRAAAGSADPVDFHFGRDGVLWRIRVDGPLAEPVDAGTEDGLSLQVIRALPDRVSFDANADVLRITMCWLVDPDDRTPGPGP